VVSTPSKYRDFQTGSVVIMHESLPEDAIGTADDDGRSIHVSMVTKVPWKQAYENPAVRQCLNDELKQLHELGVWELVERPRDTKLLPSIWVVVYKVHEQRYKARLVASGDRIPDVAVDTASPVTSLITVRLLLMLAAIWSWVHTQYDVKGAYLYALLRENERYYMAPPPGTHTTGRVCRLRRALYGLPQSGRRWNELLHEILVKIGWTQNRYDLCLYYLRHGSRLVGLIAVWVDDFKCIFSTTRVRDEFEAAMRKHVTLNRKDLPSVYVGLEQAQTPSGVRLTQSTLIKKLLREYRMEDANSRSTPAPTLRLEARGPDEPGCPTSISMPSLVGALQYVAQGTRPDIANAVNALAQYQANPSLSHWRAAQHLLRYLAGSVGAGIVCKPGKLELTAYVDAEFAGDRSRRSVTGYVIFLGGSPILWKSKRQGMVTLSTNEAELVATSELARDLSWLRLLLSDMGIDFGPRVTVYEDNRNVLAMVNGDRLLTQLNRHVDIRYKYILELVDAGWVALEYVESKRNVADVLTKPLGPGEFAPLAAALGVQ
jgi:hypothetical protein